MQTWGKHDLYEKIEFSEPGDGGAMPGLGGGLDQGSGARGSLGLGPGVGTSWSLCRWNCWLGVGDSLQFGVSPSGSCPTPIPSFPASRKDPPLVPLSPADKLALSKARHF